MRIKQGSGKATAVEMEMEGSEMGVSQPRRMTSL